MLKDRKSYETTLDAQLALWAADLDVLKAEAKRAQVTAKVSFDQGLEAMQHKHDEAAKRLHNLKAATDDAWEDMKTSTEKVWCEVKALFDGAPKSA